MTFNSNLIFKHRAIQEKIDVDKDGFITESELHDWIVNVTKRYHLKDVETRWKVYDPENRGFISLDSVINTNYGSLLQCKCLAEVLK